MVNTFSIIIPVKPGGIAAAAEYLIKNISDDPQYEILLAEGYAPSRQRNMAAREASGNILYFLDDDSLVAPDNLAICSATMLNQQIAVVGGPSITPERDSWKQRLFGYALSSLFGSGPMRNRYRIHGVARETTDRELILCNLAVRRQIFEEVGGFNEGLYPNEENEFMERVVASGYTLFYVPTMFVKRSQRRTLKAFALQMFNYGRGRGEQSRLTASYPLSSFIPLLFVCYLFIAIFLVKYVLLMLPLVLYLTITLSTSLIAGVRHGTILPLHLLWLFPLMHISNGLGLLCGVIKTKPEPALDSPVRISKLKSFGEKVAN